MSWVLSVWLTTFATSEFTVASSDSLAFSPDGRYLVFYTWEMIENDSVGVMRIVDLHGEEAPRTLDIGKVAVTSPAWSPATRKRGLFARADHQGSGLASLATTDLEMVG